GLEAPPLAGSLHEAVAVEHGMNRARRRDANIAGHPPDQQLADFPGTPMWLVLPGCHDRPLDLVGQLVGIAYRAPRAIGKRLQALILVAVENLVAGLSGYPERPAHITHPFAVQKTGHETKTFFHHRTLSPRHQHLPQKAKSVTHVSGTNRHLCLRSFSGFGAFSGSSKRGTEFVRPPP